MSEEKLQCWLSECKPFFGGTWWHSTLNVANKIQSFDHIMSDVTNIMCGAAGIVYIAIAYMV